MSGRLDLNHAKAPSESRCTLGAGEVSRAVQRRHEKQRRGVARGFWTIRIRLRRLFAAGVTSSSMMQPRYASSAKQAILETPEDEPIS